MGHVGGIFDVTFQNNKRPEFRGGFVAAAEVLSFHCFFDLANEILTVVCKTFGRPACGTGSSGLFAA